MDSAIIRAMPQPCAGLAAGLVVAVALSAPSPAAAEDLSPHAVTNLVERIKGSVVRVVSSPSGSAVLIGVGGQLLAPSSLVRKGVLSVELAGERRQAKVLATDPAFGLALLALEEGQYPAATVGSAVRLSKGAALVGLAFDEKGNLSTYQGHFTSARKSKRATHLITDVGGPVGSAVFNSRGELVAIHAGAPRATIPIEELKTRFAPPDPRAP